MLVLEGLREFGKTSPIVVVEPLGQAPTLAIAHGLEQQGGLSVQFGIGVELV